LTRIIADAAIEGRTMRPQDGTEPGPDVPPVRDEDVLPGAAAQPKAEWELQLEAEEEAARADTEESPETKTAPADQAPVDAKGK
jgi:hypothetical protein